MKTDIASNLDDKEQEFVQFGVNIQTIASILLYQANVILKPYNLTFQQYNVLRILISAEKKEVSINYISARMMDKNSNGSRLVDKLEKKGWVKKQESLIDKRTVNVQITESGVRLLDVVYKMILTEYLEKISKVISFDETKMVNSILNRTLNS
jgi:DNA-binding MarR family transcriptional regulator